MDVTFLEQAAEVLEQRGTAVDGDDLTADPGKFELEIVNIRRGERQIRLWSEYYEQLELPGYVRDVAMRPHAEWSW